MLQLPVQSLIHHSFIMGQLGYHAKNAKTVPMTNKNLRVVGESARVLEAQCILQGFTLAALSASRLTKLAAAIHTKNETKLRAAALDEDRAKIAAAISDFQARLQDELQVRMFLSVTPLDAIRYKQDEPLFGQKVHNQFPKARFEITEAGKCLALGRSTACVFHLMRAVEVALIAITACLGIPRPDNASWGIYLAEIRKERMKRGDAKWSENGLFQDLWQRIDSIKDAQRDQTMHVETIYTEEEASAILDSTKAFMNKLAARMDENGEPKA